MAIDFPATPVDGQLFTAATNGVTYRYSTTYASWLTQAGPGGGTGDFCATGATGTISTSDTLPSGFSITSGNSGSWFNLSSRVYTPPAGRYYLYAYYNGYCPSATSNLAIGIRKNGVNIVGAQSSAITANSGWANPNCSCVMDANGSDYFYPTWAGSVASNGYGFCFGAFPLTGMQGPMGAPPTAGGGIIREVTLAAPAATIDLFSLGVKSVQVLFSVKPVTDNVDLYLRAASGSTPDLTNGYGVLTLHNNHTTPTTFGGAFTQPTTGYNVANNVSNAFPVTGQITMNDLPTGGTGTAINRFTLSGSNAVYNFHSTFVSGPGGNGLQFLFTSGNIAAGSFVRVIGWP